jgi:hypothetical protein
MEDWTTAESALFEEAMEKYGKGQRQCHDNIRKWNVIGSTSARSCINYVYKRPFIEIFSEIPTQAGKPSNSIITMSFTYKL